MTPTTTLPDLTGSRSIVADLLTPAERTAIHAARWRRYLASRGRR